MGFSLTKFIKGISTVSNAGIAIVSAVATVTKSDKDDKLAEQLQGAAAAFIPNDPDGEQTARSLAAIGIKSLILDEKFRKKAGLTEFEASNILYAAMFRLNPKCVDTDEEIQALAKQVAEAYAKMG